MRGQQNIKKKKVYDKLLKPRQSFRIILYYVKIFTCIANFGWLYCTLHLV